MNIFQKLKRFQKELKNNLEFYSTYERQRINIWERI